MVYELHVRHLIKEEARKLLYLNEKTLHASITPVSLFAYRSTAAFNFGSLTYSSHNIIQLPLGLSHR